MTMERLAHLVRERIEWANGQSPQSNPSSSQEGIHDRQFPLVGTAELELNPRPLHEQIEQFGDRAVAAGCQCIQILPMFLLEGVHVMEDIPAEVAAAKQALGEEIALDLRPHLGSETARLSQLVASQIQHLEAAHPGDRQWILLSHGSRRVGSDRLVEEMANQLGAVTAYWAVSPSLETTVAELANAGHQHLGIVPYFLFAGGITDAIAACVDKLSQQFPNIHFQLAEPIGASNELADLILDLTGDATPSQR